MADPRSPFSKPPASPPQPARPRGFGALWRWFLPVAIAMIGAAVLTGIFDTTARPAWLFGGGILIAVIGVGSLISSLVAQGRAEAARLEARLEKQFEKPGSGKP